MSDRVFIEYNPWDGIAEYAHFDADENLIGIERACDPTALIENNTALKNEGNKGYGASKEWKHVASIDPLMLMQWAVEQGVTYEFINSKEGFDEIVMKYLADLDYRKFRVDI